MIKLLIYWGYGLCFFLFYIFYCRVGDYTLLSQIPNLLFTASMLIYLVKEHLALNRKSKQKERKEK
ncbi:MAG: hypothetical protein R3Y63_14480 [Eubacteriales bacterium]